MTLTRRFRDALDWAVEIHQDQVRKSGGMPYACHVLQVAGLVIEHGGDEDEAIAALLHDVVEDHGDRVGFDDIRARFGERVAEIVAGVTDATTRPKPPWRERKERYLAHLRGASRSEALVSAADKLHNGRAVLAGLRREGAATWRHFKGGREGTLWYYAEVLEAVRGRVPQALFDDLDELVQALRKVSDTDRKP